MLVGQNPEVGRRWVDPARELVISSRWGAGVESLIAEVSEAVRPG
ncbi:MULTISPECIES: hypothetical protein [unclassified Streptomyces]